MEANIKYLKDENGNVIAPVTSSDAVMYGNGTVTEGLGYKVSWKNLNGVDMNTVKTSSMGYCLNCTNLPTVPVNENGYYMVIKYNDNYVLQYFYPYAHDYLFIRRRVNGTFSNWCFYTPTGGYGANGGSYSIGSEQYPYQTIHTKFLSVPSNLIATQINANYIRFANKQGTGYNNGFTFIWTTSYTAQLWVDDTLIGNINTTATSSDERLKKNIESVDNNILKSLDNVKIKQFSFKDEENNKPLTSGIIVQDWLKSLEENNINYGDYNFITKNKDGYYFVDYIQLALLKIANLENKVEELQNEINTLKNNV